VTPRFFIFALLYWFSASSWAAQLSPEEAVRRAEIFIVQNGYTSAPEASVKHKLDDESLELNQHYRDKVNGRFNTLKPKAIGVRHGRTDGSEGWSVAFDYVNPTLSSYQCRLVTLKLDGSDMRVEHTSGRRNNFAGFALGKP